MTIMIPTENSPCVEFFIFKKGMANMHWCCCSGWGSGILKPLCVCPWLSPAWWLLLITVSGTEWALCSAQWNSSGSSLQGGRLARPCPAPCLSAAAADWSLPSFCWATASYHRGHKEARKPREPRLPSLLWLTGQLTNMLAVIQDAHMQSESVRLVILTVQKPRQHCEKNKQTTKHKCWM